jgi:hypothetical protein
MEQCHARCHQRAIRSVRMDPSIVPHLFRSTPNQIYFSFRPYFFLPLFLLYFVLSSFLLRFSTSLCCYSCASISVLFRTIELGSISSMGSRNRAQVISRRFLTAEDQFRSQGCQVRASGRKSGTVLRCQFSFHDRPVSLRRSSGYIWAIDTLVATVRGLKRSAPKFTFKCIIRARPKSEFRILPLTRVPFNAYASIIL